LHRNFQLYHRLRPSGCRKRLTRGRQRLMDRCPLLLNIDSMPAYIPPHLRQAAPRVSDPGRPPASTPTNPSPRVADPQASGSGSHRAPRIPRSSAQPLNPQAPMDRLGTPPRRGATPILASPATDLRVRRAGTPLGGREVDEMDMVQSVSRSGGDGAEGDA
jgi:hypothetical protein